MKVTKSQVLVILQFVLFGALAVAFLYFPRVGTVALEVIGALLGVSGLAVILLAVVEYGRVNRSTPNVSPDPNQRAKLVQSGVYTRVRHPIYTGVLMCATGAAIFHGHLAMIGVALVFWIFFTYKSIHEDQLLSMVYPDYREYKSRTGRFLPFSPR